MKDHTRQAVAFIAGSLISGKQSSSVYDYSASKHFSFSGESEATNVNVYDYTEKCYVSGSGQSGRFSLYHYGNSKYLDLKY